MLATDGVRRGLLGPREVPRLWQRHLLNCAVVQELIPHGVTVVDVGSGAGLPGLPLALARPDLQVVLVEPLARRATFLTQVVSELGMGVQVRRARAEDMVGSLQAPVVTARAVAPLHRLVRWCLPLADPGGRLLAIKGQSVAAEIDRDRAEVRRAGGIVERSVRCGIEVVEPATTVVIVRRSTGELGERRGGVDHA